MSKFRKKPVVIEAFQLHPNDGMTRELPPQWLFQAIVSGVVKLNPTGRATIKTLEGEMLADIGDWIIQGVKGELYPCKPDIFVATYDAAPQEDLTTLRTNGAEAWKGVPDAAGWVEGLRNDLPEEIGAGPWMLTGPDHPLFRGETPLKAAMEAQKYRRHHDPVEAQRFLDAIESIKKEGEAEDARLIALHGSLNCPACGGSGHVGDVAAPTAQEKNDE